MFFIILTYISNNKLTIIEAATANTKPQSKYFERSCIEPLGEESIMKKYFHHNNTITDVNTPFKNSVGAKSNDPSDYSTQCAFA